MDGQLGREAERLMGELNERKVELIRVDLETAFTFATIASDAGDDAEKRQRNTQNARKGYDTITRYMKTAAIEPNERIAIGNRANELHDLLRRLGEEFSD